MSQATLVLKLSPAEQTELKARLERGAFDHRSVPYASLSVKGEGVVATLYQSGKLVVQGNQAELFAQRYLGRVPEPSKPLADPTRELVGADEAGKGDYFGPLVAAAVRVAPEERPFLTKLGVGDSKRLSDDFIARIAPVIEERFPHAIEVLDPPEYNETWGRLRNVNEVLGDLHAKAIGRIVEKGTAVLIDRFAAASLMEKKLKSLGVDLTQETKAERELSVAAASVLARNGFVQRLKELSDEWAVDLQKGAGAPTDAAARRFIAVHGFDALEKVAKVHFKNTSKVKRGGA